MEKLYTVSLIHRIGAVEDKLYAAITSEDAFHQAYTYCMNRYGEKYVLMGEVRITTNLTYLPGYEIVLRRLVD